MPPDNETIAASFDARAPGYARSDWHRRSAERLVDHCALRPGDRVLDACTGTGFAALAAARVVGNTGRVYGVDISAGMLREARAAVAASGLTNVELLQADASQLPQFEGCSFDAITCATGLLYMPFREALREWRRLLRPGGVIAFSNMKAGSPRAAQIFRACAARFGLELADPTAALGSPDACRLALEEAALSAERVVEETIEFSDEDVSSAWTSNFGSAAYAAVRRLTDGDQQALKRAFEAAFERESADALKRAEMLYAVGRRERDARSSH
jgi:ubiquinone/menaquinone biosynthesis C-methylase UbiE